MGDNKKPYFEPRKFSGNNFENIDSFFKNYQRVSLINGWLESEKKSICSGILRRHCSNIL